MSTYDWSRLEGSGWRLSRHPYTITNGEFEYWFAKVGMLRVTNALVPFLAEHALVAQQEAERLVAKCRRDWRDEVKQACEGIEGIGELYDMHGWELRLRAKDKPSLFALAFIKDRTYSLIDGVQTLEWVLKLSVIIERLKKLGWREA